MKKLLFTLLTLILLIGGMTVSAQAATAWTLSDQPGITAGQYRAGTARSS